MNYALESYKSAVAWGFAHGLLSLKGVPPGPETTPPPMDQSTPLVTPAASMRNLRLRRAKAEIISLQEESM